MKELGLSDQELISLTKNAIDSSFCDKDTKSKLLAKIKLNLLILLVVVHHNVK